MSASIGALRKNFNYMIRHDSRERRLLIGLILLLIFCSIPLYLFYQWTAYFSMNPLLPPGNEIRSFELVYPPSSEGRATLLHAKFNVSSNKSIVEGVSMRLTNINVSSFRGTNESWCFSRDVGFVEIGFQHGQPALKHELIDASPSEGLMSVQHYETISGSVIQNPYTPEYPQSAYDNLMNSTISHISISEAKKGVLRVS